MRNSQKGSSLLVAIIAVVVLIIVGMTAFYVDHRIQSKKALDHAAEQYTTPEGCTGYYKHYTQGDGVDSTADWSSKYTCDIGLKEVYNNMKVWAKEKGFTVTHDKIMPGLDKDKDIEGIMCLQKDGYEGSYSFGDFNGPEDIYLGVGKVGTENC